MDDIFEYRVIKSRRLLNVVCPHCKTVQVAKRFTTHLRACVRMPSCGASKFLNTDMEKSRTEKDK